VIHLAPGGAPAAVLPREGVSYLYFGSLYFVTLGVLYLWGYWSSFGIDILEYISVAEVLELMAHPVAYGFAAFALGAVVGSYFPPLRRVFPAGGGRHPTTRWALSGSSSWSEC
jgi:hypothetical protein